MNREANNIGLNIFISSISVLDDGSKCLMENYQSTVLFNFVELQMHYPAAVYFKAGYFIGSIASYKQMIHPPKIAA